jgi:cephalosporin-C deacetylase-like acetyl esterase
VEDLGPDVFRVAEDSDETFHREDIELENMRGMKVQCSWFHPEDHHQRLPCVIYLHGNCGSRLDALEALFLLRHGFTLFSFDASGSGLSDGEYVSLGFYERQDLAAVVEYLHETNKVLSIGLWGRSMGAVTAIMYGAKDPCIRAIVADSPFSSLRELVKDMVKKHASKVPWLLIRVAVDRIRRYIISHASFDINDLDAVRFAKECEAPAVFYHGADDDFVLPYHSLQIAENYKGSCMHHVVLGDHNSSRLRDVQDTVIPFLKLYLIDKIIDSERVAPANVFADKTSPEMRARKFCMEDVVAHGDSVSEVSVDNENGL